MHKVWGYLVWVIALSMALGAEMSQSYIVLTTDKSEENLKIEANKYDKFIRENDTIQKAQKQESFTAKVVKSEGSYILKVGPFKSGDALALVYLGIRSIFPQAFILEGLIEIKEVEPQIKIVEKKVIVEKEDQTLWIALFGLGIIGILSLFLSSDQLKNLGIKHQKMQDKQSEIEKKQTLLLEKMGEKIQTVALKNVNGEKKLLEESLESIGTEEIRSRIVELKKYDEDLLRTTYEMIDFLKIKSGNIVIKEEAFQLSTMLHKLTNSVASILREKKHTLAYDIKSDVSRYLMGDTVRIYQILHNMLLDVLENEENSNVVLSIEVKKEEQVIFSIVNNNKFLTPSEMDNLFIPSSWEEVQATKKEFGFAVIKELIANMKGDFVVTSDKKRGTHYELSLPYVKDLDNKSRKQELKKHLVGKKALVVDTDIKKTKILTYMLESFGIDVLFKSSEDLARFKPHMEGLDFIIIKADDVSQKVFNFFKNINEEYKLDIVVIHNIFESDHLAEMASRIANEELFSPLIIGDVEEALNNLCLKTNKKKKETFREELQNFKILDTVKVTRSDFQIFTDKKVLIVENNLVSQQVMSSILGASELTVYKVENGVAALIFLGEHPDIDLILMDIDMPLMDGYEATRMIRKNDILKDIPVVAVTGLGFYNEMEEMALSGMDACITKPFKVGQLYIALQRYLMKKDENNIPLHEQKIVDDKREVILDTQKGISYVRSDIYYKEIVSQILIALKNSDRLVRTMIDKGEINKLHAFCIDTIGLGGTIGATRFVHLLNEMLIDISNKEEIAKREFVPMGQEEVIQIDDYAETFMTQYILRYKEEWLKLEKEMESYLIG